MKKYKLIKEYPESPKLGTIEKQHKVVTIYDNHPEFWEEIVEYSINTKVFNDQTKATYIKKEDGWYKTADKTNYTDDMITEAKHINIISDKIVKKDYEILSLIASEKNPQHKKGSIFFPNKDYKFKNMTPTEFWDIYSVKRISDNKIFTIGDLYEDLIIEKMFMSVAGDILTTYKPKQKLFTTEDGVDIFEGDKCVTVILYNFTIGNLSWQPDLQHLAPYKKEGYMKVFSTKEKAEEFILYNKPCLSINEIANLTETNPPDWLNKELIKIVKSKIQNSPCKL